MIIYKSHLRFHCFTQFLMQACNAHVYAAGYDWGSDGSDKIMSGAYVIRMAFSVRNTEHRFSSSLWATRH